MVHHRLLCERVIPRYLTPRRIPPPLRTPACTRPPCRFYSSSHDVQSIKDLPGRIYPRYVQTSSSFLSLKWPRPPRNLLLIQRLYSPEVTEAVVKFAKHMHTDYPEVNVIFEPRIASALRDRFDFPIHASDDGTSTADKVDVIATFGGDGTVLRAASLFKLHGAVPPIVSFSMGTLGFLGEWDFSEYKKVWREVYMSGSDVAAREAAVPRSSHDKLQVLDKASDAWGRTHGRSMGKQRAAKVLLRNRIKADVFDAQGNNVNDRLSHRLTAEAKSLVKPKATGPGPVSPSLRAINEIAVHRGSHPHLAIIDIYQNGHFLTETTADGILVSTPTGSTAYSLSAGGPIVHPSVQSMLITPISPCSLSFRSLVLPLDAKVTLRMSPKNRGRELDLSIDGRRCAGVEPGSEIRVEGEFVRRRDGGPDDEWHGGVPCVIRAEDDDPWVGGLNGMLKFNHPFGRGTYDE